MGISDLKAGVVAKSHCGIHVAVQPSFIWVNVVVGWKMKNSLWKTVPLIPVRNQAEMMMGPRTNRTFGLDEDLLDWLVGWLAVLLVKIMPEIPICIEEAYDSS